MYLENGWITGYIDLDSTFTINSPDPKIKIQHIHSLVINGTTIINGRYETSSITISDIRPIGVGLFVLEENSNRDSRALILLDMRRVLG